MDKQQASDEKHRRFHDKRSDFLAFVNLWLRTTSATAEGSVVESVPPPVPGHRFNYLRVREVVRTSTPSCAVVKKRPADQQSEPAGYREEIHTALLTGLLSHRHEGCR